MGAEVWVVKRDFTAAIIEEGWIVIMCMSLSVIAEEPVEAALEGVAGVAWFSEPPFSKATTDIAEVTQEFTQNGDVCRHGHLFVQSNIFVVSNRRVSGVETSHEDAP